jgi:hypothetical protein
MLSSASLAARLLNACMQLVRNSRAMLINCAIFGGAMLINCAMVGEPHHSFPAAPLRQTRQHPCSSRKHAPLGAPPFGHKHTYPVHVSHCFRSVRERVSRYVHDTTAPAECLGACCDLHLSRVSPNQHWQLCKMCKRCWNAQNLAPQVRSNALVCVCAEILHASKCCLHCYVRWQSMPIG